MISSQFKPNKDIYNIYSGLSIIYVPYKNNLTIDQGTSRVSLRHY